MRGIAFVVGSIVGVFIVRALFLDPVQIIGWDMFWNGISNGKMMNPEAVLKSETFLKCVGGFVVGGLLGVLVGSTVQKKPKDGQRP